MKWTRQQIFDDVRKKSPSYDKMSFKEFCASIFFHPGGKALRLRANGIAILKDFFPTFDVDIMDKEQSKKNMPSKHFVFLMKYCKAPYYIRNNGVIFLDEEEALIFKLCDGDIANVKNVTE